MKLIPLTQGLFAKVDNDSYEYLMQWKWYARKDNNTYYAVRDIRKKGRVECIYMHRLIMNTPKGMLTDHRDRDGLNNQRSNLRICTQQQNLRNKSKQVNNTSEYKGIRWHKSGKKWEASIMSNGEKIYLGLFTTAKDAAIAYNQAARKYFGEFAVYNDITGWEDLSEIIYKENENLHVNNTSGYKGVTFDRTKWVARIAFNGKRLHIGRFNTPLEAAKAYNKKSIELFGEFARLNPISEEQIKEKQEPEIKIPVTRKRKL